MTAARGVTLVELLIGMTLLAAFLTMVQQFFCSMLHGVRVLELASEVQEAARLGTQLIERDLREAGLDPARSIASGITRAERDAVRVARDLNGDGDTDDPNERVGYRYDGEQGALMRGLGNAPEQPMLDDVPADGLEFRYFDAEGRAIPPPPGGLDAAARARVCRIDVSLTVEIHPPGAPPGETIRRLQTASAQLRNAALR